MATVRQRTRAAPVETPAASQPQPDVNTDRLRVLLSLRGHGRTQAEAAAYFSVDVRTIRRWEQRARAMGLSALEDLKADEMVAELLRELVEQRAALRDLGAQATAAGDQRQQLHCIREQVRTIKTTADVCSRAGVFNRAVFPPPAVGGR